MSDDQVATLKKTQVLIRDRVKAIRGEYNKTLINIATDVEKTLNRCGIGRAGDISNENANQRSSGLAFPRIN